MHQLHPLRFPWQAAVLCGPPVLYLLAAAAAQLSVRRRLDIRQAWTIAWTIAWTMARTVSWAALLLSLTCAADLLLHLSGPNRSRVVLLAGPQPWRFSLYFDPVTALMLLLVAFLGMVIVAYSTAYMAGDPKERKYIRNLMMTLGAVSVLVVTGNLIVFSIAWILTSLSLHGLLTLYPERQPAMIAAHKKFLASRMGDLSLLCAVILLGLTTGSFEIGTVLERVADVHPVPLTVHLAAIFLVISAIFKCAQLPLHGWLIQVMEAPTPVSALLHAGVVNLGGFMLIRLAPVVNTTPAAQTLLMAVGCFTAVVASLVMTTRISIKVHLAWSTCAQMGFMLMECGLGLYHLAFLHLLAHSLYKAHAFLGSGGAVAQARLKRLSPTRPLPRLAAAIAAGCGGLLLTALCAWLWHRGFPMDAGVLVCITVAGLAIAGLLASLPVVRTVAGALFLPAAAAAVSLLYFGFDTFFGYLMPAWKHDLVHLPVALALCMASFVLLYAVQTLVRIHPSGRLANAIHPWFYAGLYLDELFTRATFRVWPARPPVRKAVRRDGTQPFATEGANQ